MKTTWTTSSGDVSVTLTHATGGAWQGTVGGREHRVTVEPGPRGSLVLRESSGALTTIWVARTGAVAHVAAGGRSYELREATQGRKKGGHGQDGGLEAPMPGTVLQVRVSEGDAVEKGQTLVVIEAMKMEHAIKAPRDGTVKAIAFAVGARVSPGDALIELV